MPRVAAPDPVLQDQPPGARGMTLYALKPRFQATLRPLVRSLAGAGVTANQVTIAAALGSVAVGVVLAVSAETPAFFLLLPAWLVVRMALNAIDGMLAREHGQRSDLGAFLNELGDVVSDAALYAPFALAAPFDAFGIGLVIVLAILTEFARVTAAAVGASRSYQGPMGKSDRALVFGALGAWLGLAGTLPGWLWPAPYLLSLLLLLTVRNRVAAALRSEPLDL
jgi:CDP-diacylglycerol--glycerol-3-phosphate 3-phosphatidyltransferase